MKKILAILLAMMLVLSMGVAAFAEEEPVTPAPTTASTYTDQTTVTVTKQYDLDGNGSSPAETFTLYQVGDGKKVDGEGKGENAPHLGEIIGAEFAEGVAGSTNKTAKFTINLPTYTSVGVYEYTLKETPHDEFNKVTAGVTYYDSAIKLVVTVINGADGSIRIAAVHTETGEKATKSDTITNTYSANKLTVNKTVAGILGDKKDKAFDFTANFTAPSGKTVKSTVSYVYGGETKTLTFDENGKATATFSLKHDGTITFENLPEGVSYTVTEANYSGEGYTTTANGQTSNTARGTIDASEASEVEFVNTKGGTIDTGITTDDLPYVMLLGFVVLAGAAMLLKRRAARHN